MLCRECVQPSMGGLQERELWSLGGVKRSLSLAHPLLSAQIQSPPQLKCSCLNCDVLSTQVYVRHHRGSVEAPCFKRFCDPASTHEAQATGWVHADPRCPPLCPGASMQRTLTWAALNPSLRCPRSLARPTRRSPCTPLAHRALLQLERWKKQRA